jgi:uncharacterized protein (TIGR03000 family)
MFSALAIVMSAVPSGQAAPPQIAPNNPFPPSFYGFNPGYYGPYYPGQYRYGNVQPQVYSNYGAPTLSGYGQSSPLGSGTLSSVPVPYSYRQYGSSGTYDTGSSPYPPSPGSYGYSYRQYGSPATSGSGSSGYGYGVRNLSPPARGTPARDETAVLAEIHLPTPAAEVWVEGQKTSNAGTWRRFISPPLVPGTRYVYEFRARWRQNGREDNLTRQAAVRAGDRIIVDFTKPS